VNLLHILCKLTSGDQLIVKPMCLSYLLWVKFSYSMLVYFLVIWKFCTWVQF